MLVLYIDWFVSTCAFIHSLTCSLGSSSLFTVVESLIVLFVACAMLAVIDNNDSNIYYCSGVVAD